MAQCRCHAGKFANLLALPQLSSANASRQISFSLGGAGLLIGILLALGVLSGDAQGRVNLLYLLLLFTFLPAAGLLLSIVFLLRDHGKGLAGYVLDLPLWPRQLQQQVLTLSTEKSHKYWLFYQTQVVALAFGVGGLLAFVVLLLGSDISFVWRSTLLEATDLLPVLNTLALPWRFWAEAQASLSLLQQSQDFRLAEPQYTATVLGQWWKYALAAQCCYNLIPRAVMLFIALRLYRHKIETAEISSSAKSSDNKSLNAMPLPGRLAPVVTRAELDYVLLNWSGAPEYCLHFAEQQFGHPKLLIDAAQLHAAAIPSALSKESALVVMVKSWEPPLAELADYLSGLKSGPAKSYLLLPLDFEDGEVRSTRDLHLQEWQRFAGALDNWSVLQAGVSP